MIRLLTALLLFSPLSVESKHCFEEGGVLSADEQRCYYTYSSPLSFRNAEAQCVELLNGHLAGVDNGFENSEIIGITTQVPEFLGNGTFWIGGNRIESPEWEWTDGNRMWYQAWAAGEPKENLTCAAHDKMSLYWYSANCSTRLPYLCESPSIDDDTVGCPIGYDFCYVTRACYRLLAPANFSVSEAVCNYDGGHLVSIGSDFENEWVYNFTLARQLVVGRETFIGLHSIYSNLTFEWTDGSNFVYTHWEDGDPDPEDVTRNPCVVMYTEGYSRDKFWSTWTCREADNVQAVCKMVPTAFRKS